MALRRVLVFIQVPSLRSADKHTPLNEINLKNRLHNSIKTVSKMGFARRLFAKPHFFTTPLFYQKQYLILLMSIQIQQISYLIYIKC